MRRRFIQIDGELVEVTRDYVRVAEPVAPMVMPDIKGYQSMCDGSWIGSRSKHREHLKAHNVIEVGNELDKPKPRVVRPPPGLKEAIIYHARERLRRR